MIEPTIAPVRPRVVAGGGRGVVLLEDLVPELAASGRVQTLELIGPPGFGTTTALKHLAAVLGTDSGWEFIDGEAVGGSLVQKATGAIRFPKTSLRPDPVVVRFRLAPWGRDEWIEYLLKTHKNECCSVMTRVLHDREMESLEGMPSVLTLVLDELATHDRLPDVKSAVTQIVDRHFPTGIVQPDMRDIVRLIVAYMHDDSIDARQLVDIEFSAAKQEFTTPQKRLLSVRAIQVYLVTEVAWYELSSRTPSSLFHGCWPRPLISSVGDRLVGHGKRI